MRIPLSWLREMTPVPESADPADLASELSDLGLVVEGTDRIGEGLSDIVVVRVAEIEPIKGADRVRRVVVDTGGGLTLGIVCGAWNFEVGDFVPLAPVGTTLPNGLEIQKRKMRGVFSEGMLCSGKELALSHDAEGLMVLGKEPTAKLEAGASIVEALELAPDVVFELEIAPNRPDCLSIAGVARDLAARLKLPFTLPEPSVEFGGPPAAAYGSVVVDAPELCTRLTGRVITGVTVGEPEPTVARRLALCGMRSLNSVVDASNYVMLELGQPTHPYDIQLLDGHGIVARAGRAGEEVVTLDGVARNVGPADCVIGDVTGHAAGVGGIMGGHFSEIASSTTEVLLEAAHFDAISVARTARRLGLRTEASVRFERGCDPEMVERAGLRFCELVVSAARAGGHPEPVVAPGLLDARPVVIEPAPIRVRTARVNSLLGLSLTEDDIKGYLEPIGFTVGPPPAPAPVESTADEADGEEAGAAEGSETAKDDAGAKTAAEELGGAAGDGSSPEGEAAAAGDEAQAAEAADESGVIGVTPPTFRPDTTREEDVVEEVARHYGYGKLPMRHRRAPGVGGLTAHQRGRRALRRVLAAVGAYEAWNSSFVSPADHERIGLEGAEIKVANPLTPDESVLRRSLMPGLLRSLSHNASRRNPYVRFFEIGHIFATPAEGATLPAEHESVALLLAREDDGAESAVRCWRNVADALGIAGVDIVDAPVDSLHPTRSGRLVSHDGDIVGHLGEVDPEIIAAYDLPHARIGWLEADAEHVVALIDTRSGLREVSRFPSADVDLAFAVDQAVPAAAVERALVQAAGDLAEWVRLFDVYTGPGLEPGTRSLAYRLRLNAPDHTLTEAELAKARANCVEAVEKSLPAHLRS
jgi:phenylalanyl-tRNA synthetase beta chain